MGLLTKFGISQSLGYPGASLTIVKTGAESRPTLKYLKGDVCPHDSKAYLSTQIEFYCEPKAGKVCIKVTITSLVNDRSSNNF